MKVSGDVSRLFVCTYYESLVYLDGRDIFAGFCSRLAKLSSFRLNYLFVARMIDEIKRLVSLVSDPSGFVC